MKQLISIGLLAAAIAAGAASVAEAEIGEALQGAPPGQIQIVGTVSHTDKAVDQVGNEKENKVDGRRLDLTLKGKTKPVVGPMGLFGAVSVPFISTNNRTIDQSVAGVGDVIFEAGPYFRLGEHWNLMTTGRVSLPTGSNDPKRKVNLGSGQTDSGASLKVSGVYGPLTIDSVTDYNHKGGVPKDSLGEKFTLAGKYKKWQFGTENTFTYGLDGSRKFTTGPLVRYNFKEGIHLTGVFGKDVHAQGPYQGRTPEGYSTSLRFRMPLKIPGRK
ncbi:transporter [Candidatus Woesearchaeota archaeon]|nr:transporter [Candidatus Woesearchaeota archaeon]